MIHVVLRKCRVHREQNTIFILLPVPSGRSGRRPADTFCWVNETSFDFCYDSCETCWEAEKSALVAYDIIRATDRQELGTKNIQGVVDD